MKPYTILLLLGIVASAFIWSRMARQDKRLPAIYAAALVGAFLGAKLAYLLAEGWRDVGQPDLWLRWATGKSVLGALLGGYGAVELAKHLLNYREATGDRFAVIAPIGIGLGRVGCVLHGCCQGRLCAFGHWPAAQVELGFNVVMLGVILTLRSRGIWRGQLFHLYLISYGLFRFAHEFLRDTPRVAFGVTGYQLIALAVAALSVWRWRERSRWQAELIADSR
jgi:phosphatidylglycerol:prolipoprotein diacylglycerol transferase